MSLPLVPALSQFDGGPLASQNCTATSGARLLLYGRGIRTTGSKVRAQQSDQSGGTSIPDIMRALHRGWSFEPQWAAPNDSNSGRDPIPANRESDWITETKARSLLLDGFMLIWQGDYGNLPLQYREQAGFTDDHAFTVDAFRNTPTFGPEYYVVDTIPRPSEDYDGRWIPRSALIAYSNGLSGAGRIYAAWARPLPDTSTGDDMFSLPESDGPYPATVDANTPVYDSVTDTTPRQTINAPGKPFTVVGAGSAKDTATTGRRVIYGRYSGAPVRLGYVDVGRINR